MRIIIKIGTNLITKKDNSLNKGFLKNIVDQLANLHNKKHEVLLITSGAVAAGRSEIKIKKERKNIPFRQALAAVGQSILMRTYRDFFQKYKIPVAQILLSESDFLNRRSFLNTRNTINLLLNLKTIPIINENDVTEIAELKTSDNDTLSAKVAAAINTDLLILLTDVGGLYTKNPKLKKDAKLISKVERIDKSIIQKAENTISKASLGGMLSKIDAAKYATTSGVDTIIAPGKLKNVILKIVIQKEKIGTFFKKTSTSQENQKKWLKPKRVIHAKIFIDQGANKALTQKGSSLLPSGIKKIEGKFERGDVINIYSLENKILGFGQVNYDNSDLNKIKGHQTSDIEKILEDVYEKEAIHRDNLVLTINP